MPKYKKINQKRKTDQYKRPLPNAPVELIKPEQVRDTHIHTDIYFN